MGTAQAMKDEHWHITRQSIEANQYQSCKYLHGIEALTGCNLGCTPVTWGIKSRAATRFDIFLKSLRYVNLIDKFLTFERVS